MSTETPIRCHVLHTGSSRVLERAVLRGGAWRRIRLTAIVALLEHPREGLVLLDTGYAPRVSHCRPYPWFFPFTTSDASSAAAQVAALGLGPVRHLILSHLHPDHIGGLRDFPEATLHVSEDVRPLLQQTCAGRRLAAGFFPCLLPEDFQARVRWVRGLGAQPLTGLDLFGDGAVRLVNLPGHSPGHLGAQVSLPSGRRVFFVCDACWLTRGCIENRPSSRLSTPVHHNRRAMGATLAALHGLSQRDPSLWIIPSHCPEAPEGLL